MIESITKLENHLKNEVQDIINPYTDAMTFKDMITQTDVTLGNILDLLTQVNDLLIPLETSIRRMELNLKILTIELKNSEQYKEYKTLKAKDEQALLETSICKELLLELKDYRNHLRGVHEYCCYALANSY